MGCWWEETGVGGVGGDGGGRRRGRGEMVKSQDNTGDVTRQH